MKNKIKPVLLKQGQFLRLMRVGRWEYIQRSNCTGIVIILALTKDKKVVLTQQHRVPVGKDVIEFPAGLINDGVGQSHESALDAARRELLEETGYAAKKFIEITTGPAGSGASPDILTLVLAVGLTKVGRGGGDETENITVLEAPLRRAEAWLKRKQREGFLVDPKVYAGLYFLSKYNNKTSMSHTRKNIHKRRSVS